jgi:hypothetical protein
MRGVVLAVIAAAVLVVAARYGSYVAGGSDSYCYVHQSERWAAVMRHPLSAPLQAVEPLALEAPWPDAPATLAPTGHIASPTVRGAVVPICSAGLSMAMGLFRLVGGPSAVFAVVPLFGVILVLATAAVGGRYGARIGLASALLVACSPAFLYQLVQPMSDVPAAALWMVALACATGTKPRHVVLAGVASSAAIVVRPNLVPLGFVIGAFLLLRPERSWRQRARAASTYAAWCIPGCLAVASIQWMFYGSPLSSGYGPGDVLFRADRVPTNLTRYVGWLWDMYTPLIALVVLAPLLLPGGLTLLCVALVAANIALYLPYLVFDDWTYLRFLLPTLPVLIVLIVAVIDASLRRARVPAAKTLVAVASIGLAIVFLQHARDGSTFRLQQMEARFERAGRFVGERLPANAIVVTLWESGSVRYYGHRNSIVWDQLDPAWLDRALAYLRSRGFRPYFLFEGPEEGDFRARFATASEVGAVDWPPMADILSRVRIYDPDDRMRYLAGQRVTTEYVR